MLISYNWLRDFIELKESPEEVARILTSLGFETTVRPVNRGFEKIVVGKVISRMPHPSSQKLSLCEVSTGGGEGSGGDADKIYKVVCGAPNVAAGQLVPLALPGSRVGDIILKKTEIRGVVSEGMICSAKELGIEESSDGIMTLAESGGAVRPGADFSTIYQPDTVLEVEPLPNRPDILSHYGIALEISTRLPDGRPPVLLPPVLNENIPDAPHGVRVEVLPALAAKNASPGNNPPDCALYIAVGISGISSRNCQTPEWMKNRLLICGLRPINPPADITNYVLLEIGHPLHAFDKKRLMGLAEGSGDGGAGKIFVRYGFPDEKIHALDGKTYTLNPDDIVIASGKNSESSRPAAIAGIIGGEESSATPDTSSVVLESAVFNPSRIFRTRRHLNISTESSYRFERGTSVRRARLASRRACYLFKEIFSRNINFESYFETSGDLSFFEPPKIVVFYDRIKTYTGTAIPQDKALKILSAGGFSVEQPRDSRDFVIVSPPEERIYDIKIPEDVIEEIVRIYGYENISPPRGSIGDKTIDVRHSYLADFSGNAVGSELYKFEKELRRLLKYSGFWEEVNYGLIAADSVWFRFFDRNKCYALRNPVSPEMSVLRPSLLCELWENFSARKDMLLEHRLSFEVGNIFYGGKERRSLGILAGGDILSGENTTGAWNKSPGSSCIVDFYYLKNIIERISRLVSGSSYVLFYEVLSGEKKYDSGALTEEDYLAYRINIYINTADNKYLIGAAGPVSPFLALKSGIKYPVWWVEFDIETLLICRRTLKDTVRFKPYPPYPAASMDFSFFMPEPQDPPDGKIFIEDVEREIRSAVAGVSDELVIDEIYPVDIWQSGAAVSGGEGKEAAGREEEAPSSEDEKDAHTRRTSVTMRLVLRSNKGTLDASILGDLHKRIIGHLGAKLGLVMRSVV